MPFTFTITIGTDDQALISYLDSGSADLRATHCSNPLCQPFVRRR